MQSAVGDDSKNGYHDQPAQRDDQQRRNFADGETAEVGVQAVAERRNGQKEIRLRARVSRHERTGYRDSGAVAAPEYTERLSAQIFLPERDGAIPRQFRRRFVVTRRRVIVKAMTRVRVQMTRVSHTVLL